MVMRLSQGQLNLLEICPRRFQHLHLEQLGALMSSEQQERLNWGNRFHLLMQQHELGLPMTVLSEVEEPLQRCAQALITTALAWQNPATFRQSEHRRIVEFAGYLLTVIYDLLILEPQRAQILDWKTYPQPEQRRSLEHNWQTRLYPFVLAETTNYRPEDISMTYWFVQAGDQDATPIEPQHLTFNYNTLQHQRDRQDISHLLDQLTQWRSNQQPFPQVDESQGYCTTCPFAVRCQRGEQTPDRSLELTLAEIQEVVLE